VFIEKDVHHPTARKCTSPVRSTDWCKWCNESRTFPEQIAELQSDGSGRAFPKHPYKRDAAHLGQQVLVRPPACSVRDSMPIGCRAGVAEARTSFVCHHSGGAPALRLADAAETRSSLLSVCFGRRPDRLWFVRQEAGRARGGRLSRRTSLSRVSLTASDALKEIDGHPRVPVELRIEPDFIRPYG
jgi:hypothetical protein